MQDLKTPYLNLPLPAQGNKLRQDRPRIANSFTALDAHAEATDARLDGVEGRATALEARAAHNEADAATYAEQTDAALAGLGGRTTALEGRAEQGEAELARLEADKATRAEQAAALAAHEADAAAHDALVQRITVGNLSPIIGICCVEDGGGAGLWCNVDAEGQPVSPNRRYFDFHPTYSALRRVLVDGQIMQEHSKFYYKSFQIASGPFAGRRARLISPGQQDGFKPYPSFIPNGREVDHWYCGTYAGTNEGGSPLKIGSRPAKAPIVNLNFPTMQQYCRNRNTGGVTGFDLWNIYQVSEIQLLSLIEFATPDSQATCGRGRVDTDSAGLVDATDVSTATWRGHVGLWGNVWQMVDGIDVTPAGTLRLFRNDGSKAFVDTGFVCPAFDGTNVAYIQTFKTGSGNGFDFDDIFFPATTTTNAALATVPDGFWGRYGAAGNVLYLGAAWPHAGLAGLFACHVATPASHGSTAIGCRLARV